MNALIREDYSLRDVTDLFEMITKKKELFLNKHDKLFDLAEEFVLYYVENATELYETMHPSVAYTNTEEEELWLTDDEWQEKQSKPPISSEQQNSTKEDIDDDEPEWIDIEWNNHTEIEQKQREILRQLEDQRYIKDLFIQANEDLEAAEILLQQQCNAQAILLFQQANEKGLKALWLKRGPIRYNIHNEYFMTHKLEFLTRMVLTAEERKMEEDNEIVNQARLMEELGRSKGDYRPLCIRQDTPQQILVYNLNHGPFSQKQTP